MKSCIILFICLITTGISVAQTKIKAADIITQINSGKAVEYTNVEIEGDLDLTDLENRRLEYSSSRWSNGGKTYESSVDVLLKFTSCTFLGNVLSYYTIERSNETYVAHFSKDVAFSNCVFRNASEFKYSEFHGVANFTGSTFNDEANFKYAEFSQGPLFSNVKFESGADFKYTTRDAPGLIQI